MRQAALVLGLASREKPWEILGLFLAWKELRSKKHRDGDEQLPPPSTLPKSFHATKLPLMSSHFFPDVVFPSSASLNQFKGDFEAFSPRKPRRLNPMPAAAGALLRRGLVCSRDFGFRGHPINPGSSSRGFLGTLLAALFGVAGGCVRGGCLRMERGKLPNIPIFLD